MHPDQTQPGDVPDEVEPAPPPPSSLTLDDCMQFVWRLGRDGGLSPAQAADVCLMTLLRLSDRHTGSELLPSDVTRWVLSTAVEECRTARRLAGWRRPRLVSVEAETVEVRS